MPTPIPLSHPTYRPDIDGLRCVAVLSVLAFHAAPGWLRGGFVGVDIFFVISGFLISTIVFSNLEAGSFSLRTFYARRILRIFPALALVLATTLVLGWFVLLPEELAQLGRHIRSGAFFISNVQLWREAGYFDALSDTKPLLHLWSLGVEEQFYIVWPLLLMAAWRWRHRLLPMVVAVVALSFVVNLWQVQRDATAAFFLPFARFWELLGGALLAWARLHPSPWFAATGQRVAWRSATIPDGAVPPVDRWMANALAGAGALLLAYAVTAIGAESAFPGHLALAPVGGAVLLIAAGPGAWINRVVLSNRVAVWFGLISYPLYLWHWPLLSLARVMERGVPRADIRAAIALLSVLLAWLTVWLLERPLRFGGRRRAKVALLCVVMLCLGLAGAVVRQQKGFPSRFAGQWDLPLLAQTERPDATVFSDGSCPRLLGIGITGATVCLVSGPKPDVLVIGDSHAMALNSAAVLEGAPVTTLLLGRHGCPPVIGYTVGDRGRMLGCGELAEQVLDVLKRHTDLRTVVLTSRGPLYFSGEGYGVEGRSPYSLHAFDGTQAPPPERFYQGTTRMVRALLEARQDVVYVIDPPELGEDPRTCIIERPVTLLAAAVSDCTQERARVLARQAQYRAIIDRVRADNPRLKVYDPLDLFCDASRCHGLRDGVLLYRDDDHISTRASRLVLDDMRRRGLLP